MSKQTEQKSEKKFEDLYYAESAKTKELQTQLDEALNLNKGLNAKISIFRDKLIHAAIGFFLTQGKTKADSAKLAQSYVNSL